METRAPTTPTGRGAASGALRLALLAGLASATVVAAADREYRVDWRTQLPEWRFPAGMVRLDPASGTIGLVQHRGRYNAASDAAQFSHAMVDKTTRTGGVHPDKVGSSPATGPRAADGRADTYWQPSPDDRLADWWLELDLGRATVVTDVRLVFPDRPGARPLQQFTLFGSEGRRTSSRQDVHFYHVLGGTTRPNADTAVVFDVRPTVRELVRALPDTAAVAQQPYESTYDVLQYIRFVADTKSADAALAEIEAYTPGENIALGTLARLGSVVDVNQPGAKPEPGTMADGTMNEMWGSSFWGAAWEWDLGGLFWVREIVMRASDWEQRVRWAGVLFVQILPHTLRVSDGARTLTGAIDYEDLFAADGDLFGATLDNMPLQVDYRFAPRRVRYLQADWQGYWQTGWIGETIIIPAGYAAEATMVSGLIDLSQAAGASGSRVMRALSWETEPLPEGAYVRARTRSGNTVIDSVRYFHKDGRQISQELYNRLPASLRGATQTYRVAGPDWSGWSNWYTEPGAAFLSPSPRRYVQLMLVLGSERYDTAPVVRSLSVLHTEAVLTDIVGALAPREVRAGAETLFTYTLTPTSRAAGERFNRILIRTPSQATPAGVQVSIGGVPEPQTSVTVEVRPPDSLIVAHREVRTEPVQVRFSASVVGNATQVPALVGYSAAAGLPSLWQPVNEQAPYSTTVLVSSVAATSAYLANLAVTPVITPNGDGANEVAEVTFVRLRAELLPAAGTADAAQVAVHDLSGRQVRVLAGQAGGDGRWRYRWDGRDAAGARVPPGTYICRLLVQAQAGDETAFRTIAVVY